MQLNSGQVRIRNWTYEEIIKLIDLPKNDVEKFETSYNSTIFYTECDCCSKPIFIKEIKNSERTLIYFHNESGLLCPRCKNFCSKHDEIFEFIKYLKHIDYIRNGKSSINRNDLFNIVCNLESHRDIDLD